MNMRTQRVGGAVDLIQIILGIDVLYCHSGQHLFA